MDPKLQLIIALIAGLVDQAEQIGQLIDILAGEITDAELHKLRRAADDANDELTSLVVRLREGAAHHSPVPGS